MRPFCPSAKFFSPRCSFLPHLFRHLLLPSPRKMGRLALLVSHARRCYRLSSLLSGSGASPIPSSFPRSLSSSAPIAPVSYPVKHKDPHDEGEPAASEDAAPPPSQPPLPPPPPPPRRSRTGLDGDSRSWTREDARFVKDVPAISPVSYPSRVAPLPEYTVPDQAEERTKEEKVKDEQLERESRRIQSGTRTRSFFAFQDEVKVPFPKLIVQEEKPQKVQMDLGEAIRLVKANAIRRFVETVEAHVNLGVDPRRGDQMVRGALTLPHGTGKTVRVAVFAEGAAAEEATAAGADIVGGDELIEEIKIGGGKLNFDKCIATPMYMPRLSKIARILGPRGLMPNPKLGSVTSDVSGAVKEAKSGRIDFKIDKTAIVHAGLGKVNFSEESLRENIGAFVHALLLAKPVGLKKTSKYAGYVKNFTISSTMGPGFPVSIQSLSAAADHYNKVQVK